MVDKALRVLDKIVQTNKDLNQEKEDRESKRLEKLEAKLESLLSDRNSLSPAAAMNLRNEAMMLDKLASFALDVADKIEKNHKDLKKKKLEEVKEALMEKLGIPAEFVDQLAVLVKAGPKALREAAEVYRNEAQKKREQADFLTVEIERMDKEIKELNHIKDKVSNSKGTKEMSMNEYVLKLRYEESLRDKADLVLKRVLEQMEGMNGEEVSKAS